MLVIRWLFCPLLVVLVGACAPHHYSLPESLRADREGTIETAAFVVTPPEGSWITGDVTIRTRGEPWPSETCRPAVVSSTGAGMVRIALARFGEPLATLHLCHVSSWTIDIEVPSDHLTWQLSVYALEDPDVDPALSDEARAAAFVAGLAETMQSPPTGYERFEIGGAAHFRLDFEVVDTPYQRGRQWATLRFSPELVILYHSAHEPGPEWQDWIVFESLRPKR
jgi:hypothetical protein